MGLDGNDKPAHRTWVDTHNMGNSDELHSIRQEILDGPISYDKYLAKKGILLQESSSPSLYHIY